MGSPDMEDVISVLDGRPEAVEEISNAPVEVKKFLVETCAHLLEQDAFIESLAGHLEFDGDSPKRVSLFIDKVGEIASISLQED